MLIREASINLKLVKIKGHSGITGNDIADKLAKKGQCGNNLFRNNVDFINNILSYFSVFIDKPIEVNIRRFILKILATAKLFHKILPLEFILATRKLKLYKEMKCIIKCNKKENWNHLFKCQAYVELQQNQKNFKVLTFLVLEMKVEIYLTIRLQKDFKISLAKVQTLMANILIQFILAFKELMWKSRCEQVILWEKREGISRTNKITSKSKAKDNSNQPSEFKVKNNSNQLSNKVKILQMGKVDQLQKSVSLVKKSMDTFVRKYICEDWILIKKKVNKITLYMSKKLLD
ncbi:hypothetical protein RhiirC2_790990 [Rhizophagus irregularis]|uniref:RNase H type-1 domain-containing protein n=1 Tax=Rhizophagus irregularis TaxID=588596 RepID=A0A2N1MK56_9GLOM|nr:hypothetical protein RhiirC2_790990 [Rhizophagus irregularis]